MQCGPVLLIKPVDLVSDLPQAGWANTRQRQYLRVGQYVEIRHPSEPVRNQRLCKPYAKAGVLDCVFVVFGV